MIRMTKYLPWYEERYAKAFTEFIQYLDGHSWIKVLGLISQKNPVILTHKCIFKLSIIKYGKKRSTMVP